MGVAHLSKKKLLTEKISLLYLRLNRSIEKIANNIERRKHPNPCDNPKTAQDATPEARAKRLRDNELRRFLRKKSY